MLWLILTGEHRCILLPQLILCDSQMTKQLLIGKSVDNPGQLPHVANPGLLSVLTLQLLKSAKTDRRG